MVIRGRGFRTAFNDWCRGLFPVWREAFFHDNSGVTTYNENIAREVYQTAILFVKMAESLLENLEARND